MRSGASKMLVFLGLASTAGLEPIGSEAVQGSLEQATLAAIEKEVK
jgi:hypothetical protein